MEDFKLKHFERSHPGVALPTILELSEIEAREIRDRLCKHTGLPADSSALALTRWISENATKIPHADPRSRRFDLRGILGELGIRPATHMLVNWYRFDRIDRIALIDLTRYFSDFWYPDSDDIEILDDSCAWVLAVSHAGELGLTVLDIP